MKEPAWVNVKTKGGSYMIGGRHALEFLLWHRSPVNTCKHVSFSRGRFSLHLNKPRSGSYEKGQLTVVTNVPA